MSEYSDRPSEPSLPSDPPVSSREPSEEIAPFEDPEEQEYRLAGMRKPWIDPTFAQAHPEFAFRLHAPVVAGFMHDLGLNPGLVDLAYLGTSPESEATREDLQRRSPDSLIGLGYSTRVQDPENNPHDTVVVDPVKLIVRSQGRIQPVEFQHLLGYETGRGIAYLAHEIYRAEPSILNYFSRRKPPDRFVAMTLQDKAVDTQGFIIDPYR